MEDEKVKRFFAAILAVSVSVFDSASAETIGRVDTAWNLFKNHAIEIEAFDDPLVGGVTCYVSHAKTGGAVGLVGIAEDKSVGSVACRQVGDEIKFNGPLPLKEDVFSEKASLLFKTVRVARIVDTKRNVLTYLVYSTRLIGGSPMNVITAVPVKLSNKIPTK
jgi:CreA protein